MEEFQHSNVMGGSTAARRRNCPGSYKQEKDIPAGISSDDADRGSMLHAAMELLITADPQEMRDAKELFGELLGQDLGFEGQEITEELIDTKLGPALAAWFEITKEWEIDDWFIEQRVSLEEVIPHAFGKADILGKDTNKRLHVLDWKFGDGIVVDVEANDGNAFYAAAALYDQSDEELVEFCQDITGIVFHIIQPRVGSEVIKHTWETTEEWIEVWLDQSVTAAQIAQTDNPPLKVGDWCRFCKAKAKCPEYDRVGDQFLTLKPKTLDPVTLGKALQQAQDLKARIKAVFELAQEEMENGVSIPGWKLVQSQPRRQWSDSKKAEARLKQARLPHKELYKSTLISPTQLEKLKPRLYNKVEKDFVVWHSSGLTVVQDSDKREAVTDSMELLSHALPSPEEK